MKAHDADPGRWQVDPVGGVLGLQFNEFWQGEWTAGKLRAGSIYRIRVPIDSRPGNGLHSLNWNLHDPAPEWVDVLLVVSQGRGRLGLLGRTADSLRAERRCSRKAIEWIAGDYLALVANWTSKTNWTPEWPHGQTPLSKALLTMARRWAHPRPGYAASTSDGGTHIVRGGLPELGRRR